jgi:hypothetical protein
MKWSPLLKAALLSAGLTLSSFVAWEVGLRASGVGHSFDDGVELWSHHRAQIYAAPGECTVFIGSSRIKYDLDIPTWEKQTGTRAVQLAIEGSSPLPVLEELAADPLFRGNLVVDVTESLFFTNSPFNTEFPKEHVTYYGDRTPAQKASFPVNKLLESHFVFLDRDNFSLNALLRNVPLQNRKGVFAIPNMWPFEFSNISFNRQNKMLPRFLVDTNLQKRVTGNWLFFAKINEEKPASGWKMDSLLMVIKSATDKIKARGGSLLFVRTPSSGPFWEWEKASFPRKAYWERLLQATGVPGIHFEDHTDMAGLICPEWSHLSPGGAIIFTNAFISVMRERRIMIKT